MELLVVQYTRPTLSYDAQPSKKMQPAAFCYQHFEHSNVYNKNTLHLTLRQILAASAANTQLKHHTVYLQQTLYCTLGHIYHTKAGKSFCVIIYCALYTSGVSSESVIISALVCANSCALV